MYKLHPSRVAHQKPGNLKFCPHLSLIYRNRRDSLILKNRFFIFLYFILSKKGSSKHKFKVSTLDIRIKLSGLQVSYSIFSCSVDIVNDLNYHEFNELISVYILANK